MPESHLFLCFAPEGGNPEYQRVRVSLAKPTMPRSIGAAIGKLTRPIKPQANATGYVVQLVACPAACATCGSFGS
jgi:hypothetical protein